MNSNSRSFSFNIGRCSSSQNTSTSQSSVTASNASSRKDFITNDDLEIKFQALEYRLFEKLKEALKKDLLKDILNVEKFNQVKKANGTNTLLILEEALTESDIQRVVQTEFSHLYTLRYVKSEL